MSFTTTDLTNLEAALATGKTEVRLGDAIVKYQTTAELINAIEFVRGDLAANGLLTVPSAQARMSYTTYSRD